MDADPILALRPFVPAKDFATSLRYYEALGFRPTHRDDHVAMLRLGACGFILQNFYVRELAENFMLELRVRDVTAWWARTDPAALVEPFGVKPPIPPAMQPWGLRVGFLFDPTGVLWHVAEPPF